MNNIILIGFMGCGKTSVGKRLSEICNMRFMDTDEYIVTKEQCSISEIFEKKGEKYFRNLETESLMELLEKNLSNTVISVGGGLPVKEENRELLKRLGMVVYLRANAETIYKRLRHDTTRPLLQTENPRGRIADLLNDREQLYEAAANFMVDVDDKNFDVIIQNIQDERIS